MFRNNFVFKMNCLSYLGKAVFFIIMFRLKYVETFFLFDNRL